MLCIYFLLLVCFTLGHESLILICTLSPVQSSVFMLRPLLLYGRVTILSSYMLSNPDRQPLNKYLCSGLCSCMAGVTNLACSCSLVQTCSLSTNIYASAFAAVGQGSPIWRATCSLVQTGSLSTNIYAPASAAVWQGSQIWRAHAL
jgi:hypothetical protein